MKSSSFVQSCQLKLCGRDVTRQTQTYILGPEGGICACVVLAQVEQGTLGGEF